MNEARVYLVFPEREEAGQGETHTQGNCLGLANYPEAVWIADRGSSNLDAKPVGIVNVNKWFRPGTIS